MSPPVISGYYNKVHSPDGLWTTEMFFSHLDAGSLRSGFQHGWVLVKQLFWVADYQPISRFIKCIFKSSLASFCRVVLSHSVVSHSLWPHGLQPARILCPWDSPGKNTGVGCQFHLQGIFPTQGSNPGLPNCRQILYQLSHQGSPRILEWVAYPFSRGSSQPRKWTQVSCIAGGFFTSWATRETWALLIRTLIPFRNSTLLAKLPPQGWTPNTITLRGRVSTYEFWRDTNIQSKQGLFN